ncbi:hypothetical protein MOD96_10940, partial [Bacillus sp. S17B2]|nr:hypothetical protein [Bacillus sp. S17B2]
LNKAIEINGFEDDLEDLEEEAKKRCSCHTE